MKHKTFELIEVKADGDAGEVVALASVFNNVDLVGDRIKPGAFTKTLKAWQEKGDPIPIVSSHSWDDPMAHIGIAEAKNVTQTKDGLMVKGQLDMDNPLAAQVHRLMKRRSLTGAGNFGYTVPEDGEFMDDKGVNNITEIDLIEVGPTLKGANPQAQLQAVKSALEVEEPVSEDGIDEEPVTANSEKDEEPQRVNSAPDPLKKRSMELAMEISRDGVQRYEPEVKAPEPEPPSVSELRRRSFEAILEVARGS